MPILERLLRRGPRRRRPNSTGSEGARSKYVPLTPARAGVPSPGVETGCRWYHFLPPWRLAWVTGLAVLTIFAPAACADPLLLTRPVGALHALASEVALRTAYQELGLDVVVEPLPAQTSLEQSISGASDGEVSRVFVLGEYTASLIRVPTPLAQLSTVAVWRSSGDVHVASLDDLADLEIGRVRGVIHAAMATRRFHRVRAVDDLDTLLSLVVSGEIDVGVDSRMALQVAVAQVGSADDVVLSEPLQTLTVHHYLHERHAALVPQVNEILDRMMREGILSRLQEIFDEGYFLHASMSR